MNRLLRNLIFIPIIAFFPMVLSVAIIGSFWNIRDLEWLFPDKNAWKVYVGWMVILTVIIVVRHFNKKVKE